MNKILVDGGQRLFGNIRISGMKNSALPVIFACLLIKEECILENIPHVSDVENALEILRKMGARAEFVSTNTVKINTKNAQNSNLAFDLISKMRASSYLMSAYVVRYGQIYMPYPGGCNFGSRPIEQHLKGLRLLGIDSEESNGFVELKVKNKLKSNKITLDKISVGATINMIIASVLLEGRTVIECVAKEPHVMDLICFLNSCGAEISHFGTYIEVKGVSKLHGVKYRIFGDMIEALTYVTCVGVAGGDLTLENIEYEHISSVVPIFKGMNIDIAFSNNGIRVVSNCPNGANVETAPYPLFPTDLHPQFASLLCYCENGGSITENIFSGRFAYVYELEKMGAIIKREGNKVIIAKSKLCGAVLDATDLRAGAGLVVAALGAQGTSVINNVNYIVRGYEDLVPKLASVGGNIKLI